MKMYKKMAKAISYDPKKRSKKNVKYIVIHYTGNAGDTAKGNVNYFANTNKREAGAHFFVDRQGKIARSIPMNRTAWAVGGDQRSGMKGEAKYYNKCTNYNSVSIELCDVATKDPSQKQIKAVKKLIKYIRKYCPNAKTVIRHWDVNGKKCPLRMIGEKTTATGKKWKSFKKEVV